MTNNECAQIIAECIKRKAQDKPGYSLRAVARDLKVSPAYLSLIINGKKKLNLNRVPALIEYFEMQEVEAKRFKLSAIKNKLGSFGSVMLDECCF